MRLIDADALFTALNGAKWFDNADREIALDLVEDAPTVDAVSAKHGHWNVKYAPSKDELTLIECSECGARQFVMNPKKERYCFNCGAKMDGDENAVD